LILKIALPALLDKYIYSALSFASPCVENVDCRPNAFEAFPQILETNNTFAISETAKPCLGKEDAICQEIVLKTFPY
jgi:hypothetical protein